METKDWITIGSVIVIMIGWFTNSYLNREHEIFKKRLDYRLTMLESYIPVAESIALQKEKDFIIKLQKAQVKFLLYGTKKEISLINEIVESAQKNQHDKMMETSAKLMNLIRADIRLKLDLSSI